MSKPRIGLALGSGSARGWAHIGIIRGLREMGIEPDVITGTSIGALVGGAHAGGYRGGVAGGPPRHGTAGRHRVIMGGRNPDRGSCRALALVL